MPAVLLMENAARAAAEEAYAMLHKNGRRVSNTRVLVFCGGGNNGGDGYALARHLHNAGVTVGIFSLVDPSKLTGPAALNRRILKSTCVEIQDVPDFGSSSRRPEQWGTPDLIVDAILGTGFSGGALRPHIASAVAKINRLSAERKIPVLAVDIPSGLDCDTGVAADPTIRATTTITFVARKTGFSKPSAKKYLGRVVVAGIGVPREFYLALSARSRRPIPGNKKSRS